MLEKPLTWVEISKSALLNNLAAFRELVGQKVQQMPVVKSNAYGHGLIEVAKTITPKTDWLAVTSLEEALTIRKAGVKKPIFVLGFFDCTDLKFVPGKSIILPVYTIESAKLISKIAQKAGRRVPVHLKVDVGTTRIGLLPNEAVAFAKRIQKLPGLALEGVFSHLADSENFNQEYTNRQIKTFEKVIAALEQNKISLKYRHLACSAATIINPRSRFNLVRIGISLYGLWPSKDTKALYEKHFNGFKLIPALSWHTTVIQVKTVPINTFIGYGCTYKTKRKTKLAVLPVGYWDGYDRKLSNHGEVLIRGRRARVLGRVCMNMVMVDATDIPGVRLRDEAILIGAQGKELISAEELAEKVGTINYEIVTRINPLIPRGVV